MNEFSDKIKSSGMAIEEKRGGTGNFSGTIVKKAISLLLLVVCVLTIFSLSCLLFDKGAVLVARDVVSVRLPES